MSRRQVVVIAGLVAAMAVVVYLLWPSFRTSFNSAPANPATSLTSDNGRLLFNVTLHTPDEIAGMLARAEELAKTRRSDIRESGIALVLHGPEIEIFAKKNYSKYRATVDQAARLDAEKIIDVKICRTEMKSRGIREDELPTYVEVVPYGPEEEERLRRKGYVYF